METRLSCEVLASSNDEAGNSVPPLETAQDAVGTLKTVVYFDHTALMSGGEIALLHLVQHLDTAAIAPSSSSAPTDRSIPNSPRPASRPISSSSMNASETPVKTASTCAICSNPAPPSPS